MRYGVVMPHANRFATAEAIRAIAHATEDLGYDSLWVNDHIIVHQGSDYIPEFMDEPLAILGFLAAETQHVTLGTSVLILPYRDPVFAAKFTSTVDYICGGRLVVGASPGFQPRAAGRRVPQGPLPSAR